MGVINLVFKGSPTPHANHSRFDRENFLVEGSYDAHASLIERTLVAKTVMDRLPMGFNSKTVSFVPKAEYTSDEIALLKNKRLQIDMPDEGTIMQKVIAVDTGKIEDDLSRYIKPTNKRGSRTSVTVSGFVARACDAAPFTKTPQECFDSLRLDYCNTQYVDPNQAVYLIRFTDGKDYIIPFNDIFGGNVKKEQPETGNGYLGSSSHVIPEFVAGSGERGRGAVVTDGAIFLLSPEGSETVVAIFNKKDKTFELL